jgi:predicted DNA-binding transcriptional regulator AlpA
MNARSKPEETIDDLYAQLADAKEAEPLLLTAAQVAQLLQISLRTLWRLRSGRKVPLPVNLGASVRWRRKEVLEWVANGCQGTNDSDNKGRRR